MNDFFSGWNPADPTETATHMTHWPPNPFAHPTCWFCRWDAAHEHHTGGAKRNRLCPSCNPDAPRPELEPV